ncbi:MAG TPA: antibiotic biosynthesis monooxygenase [Jiangellaceae bacterium]|nr:antibiotic biosynthesis monooxygenase [Jiangellaceae bacterium]
MAVVRITRFHVDPADAAEMLTRRAALIAAVRAAHPGLTEARLAKLDDETWIDMWHWESQSSLEAALAGAPGLPSAAPAFALVRDASAELAEIVDER